MRRDMDLVRFILREVEDAGGPVRARELVGDDRAFDEVLYHIELLHAHGLIDARVTRTKGATSAVVLGLTWDGCDYLDAMRDDRVWERAKAAICEAVGSTTMGVVKTACVKAAEMMVLSQLSA